MAGYSVELRVDCLVDKSVRCWVVRWVGPKADMRAGYSAEERVEQRAANLAGC